MAEAKPRLVGLNHIALEVGDVDAALSFTDKFSPSSCGDEAKGKPSLIWAINS
jgi:hypothetical protein